MVAFLVSAWIEILSAAFGIASEDVALLVSAWIEIEALDLIPHG